MASPNSYEPPVFCLCYHPGCGKLDLMVSLSCLKSSTNQPGLIELLLQFDSIPYCWCPPPSLGIASMTGTADVYVTSLPLDPTKALLEVKAEYVPDQGLRKTFPVDPHYVPGPANSVRLPPLPVAPTHHKVVIGGQLSPSLHPSVEDMWLRVRRYNYKA
ncbi:hypothetical protein AMECASPLE_018786 [Ameca splendens]|uniref:Uncharacterized protein n=1 Tax=Ameca splendens TaxID=208324 RepID=A0ABV0XFV9_9TELE